MNKPKQEAEAIVKKYLIIVSEENLSSDKILLYTAKECAKAEINAIIVKLVKWSDYFDNGHGAYDSALEYYQNILSELEK